MSRQWSRPGVGPRTEVLAVRAATIDPVPQAATIDPVPQAATIDPVPQAATIDPVPWWTEPDIVDGFRLQRARF